jgi:hypothetical protein
MSFLIYPKEEDLMSGSGKAGNGRGNNRKRPSRWQNKDSNTWQEGNVSALGREPAEARNLGSARRTVPSERKSVSANQTRQNRESHSKKGSENFRREKAAFVERPKWIPPKINTNPLPVPDCPWCGKPIRDIALAISDKDTGAPVHFECVAARIAGGENLEKGDTVTYIGGGRFGIVSLGRQDSSDHLQMIRRDFKIKKIIEWENNDKRAEWRSIICDHYSVT